VDTTERAPAADAGEPRRPVPSDPVEVAAPRGARRDLVRDAAVLFGLAGLAVTQPMLDLFGNNPTFFVAGNYGRRTIVVFALLVAVVPAAVVFALTAPAGLAGRRVAAIAHGVGVGLLAALFGLVLCRTLGIDAVAVAFGGAILLGVAVALAEARSGLVRSFLAYLAVGNLAFLGLFGLASPTADLLTGTYRADGGTVAIPPLPGPVTVVVLDEFSLGSMLRPDGTINDVRYPHLAALAAESTWFRNASAENTSTFISVPSIMTGVASSEGALPTYSDHPRNLFTLFGARYPVSAYEPVTDLCPPDTCGRPPGRPLSQALSDAAIVYRHRVLPARLREGLPPVDHGWGNFGDTVGGGEPLGQAETTVATTTAGEPDPMARLAEMAPEDGGRVGQASVLLRQARLVTGEPSINLIHVLLPHHPYELTPWGVRTTDTWLPREMPDPGEPRYDRAFAELRALQAMQLGAVDDLIGEMIAHLRATGAWDSGTFVLTSDHGVDIAPPSFTRRLDDANQDDLLRIPLFIKSPGQTAGTVDDAPATTLDVLPSLIDILGIEADWEMDGHSLFDGSPPGYERALTTDLEDAFDRFASQQVGADGDDWNALVAIGDQGDLVGTRVADHDLGERSDLSWTYAEADALADPAAAGGRAPVLMSGEVRGSERVPPDLVVALDGVIAGTLGGYEEDGDGWSFTGLLGPEVEGGADEVVAYEVERDGVTVTLRPLVT
jgi:hypothetical protein